MPKSTTGSVLGLKCVWKTSLMDKRYCSSIQPYHH